MNLENVGGAWRMWEELKSVVTYSFLWFGTVTDETLHFQVAEYFDKSTPYGHLIIHIMTARVCLIQL